MYSKTELKKLKANFWEGFCTYCSYIPELKNRKSKFMLYNTKMKGIEMKFEASREGAFVILEINLKNEQARLDKFEQFERYKSLIENNFHGELVWDFAFRRESGEEVCRIYAQKRGIDLHRRSDWIAFYEFMSTNMLKLENVFKEIKEGIT